MAQWLSKTQGPERQIKKELLPTAWHPDRALDWCMSKDEKKTDRKIVEVTNSCF